MFLKQKFAAWIKKIRLFLTHPICIDLVKLAYLAGLLVLLFCTYFSPAITEISNLVHQINTPKTRTRPSPSNPAKSEIQLVNSFYLNTSDSDLRPLSPVTRHNVHLFSIFFIQKNEFLQHEYFNFFVMLQITFLHRSEDSGPDSPGTDTYSIRECVQADCLRYFPDIDLPFGPVDSKAEGFRRIRAYLNFLFTFHEERITLMRLRLYYTHKHKGRVRARTGDSKTLKLLRRKTDDKYFFFAFQEFRRKSAMDASSFVSAD